VLAARYTLWPLDRVRMRREETDAWILEQAGMKERRYK
jgi:hypothetical protein